MLIEFRVKNFRSLRDEQVLSLLASNDKNLLETHSHQTGNQGGATCVTQCGNLRRQCQWQVQSTARIAIYATHCRLGFGD